MDRDEILDAIRDVARRHLAWEGSLRPDTRIVEEMQLDSIRLLTLVIEIENRFRICLDKGDDAEIETLDDLVEAIRSKLDAPASNAG